MELYDPFSAVQVIVLDIKGFLGAAPLENCSVHLGYLEYVPVIGLHFPHITYSAE